MIFQHALKNSLEKYRGHVAIENGEKQISYAALLHIGKKITDYLQQQGLEKEVVGILLDDRADWIAAVTGIVNARCIIVPLDGSMPENRLQTMLQDLGLKYVLTARAVRTPAAFTNAIQLLYLDDISESNEEDYKSLPAPEYSEDDSLYIYYTSGSTGTPKGIVGRNESLLQFLQWEIEAFNINSRCRVSQLISPYFDAFLRDIFVPLLTGGTICIPPQEEDFYSPAKMINWINASRVTIIHCVPSVFRLFNTPSLTANDFAGLQYIMLSGEKIIPAELENWYNVFGSRIQLVNFYGATETTMIRFYYNIQPEDVRQAKIPIGQPIAGTDYLIAKDNLKPCDVLMPGELYIISPYMTKGYLNAHGLTNEKFIKLNEGTPDEKIAFKTGDIARLLANGQIDLMGREDRQVKLRGIRIEPAEIEQALMQSGWIKNTIVLKQTAETNEEALLAFVIINTDAQPAAWQQALQQHLEKSLPAYMIPSGIIEVKEFPLLSNGKINYKKLLEQSVTTTIIEPANETERKILFIWKEILGDKPISTDESFIRAGGNSLSTMRLMGRLYKEFNTRISLGELFNNLTIKKQAGYIKQAKKDFVMVIPKASAKPAYNLSTAQERLYYQYDQNKFTTTYNLPMAWQVNGEVNKNKIETVIKKLIERHESLRTEFTMQQGKITQSVRETVDFTLEEMDGRGRDIEDSITAFTRPFDLSKAPLIRCGIISDWNDKKILVVDIHHIVCDGMSQQVLFTDFLKLYTGEELKPLGITYKDYAEWENNFRLTDEYLSCREFWLQTLSGEIPALGLPTINKDIHDTSGQGGSVSFTMHRGQLQPLMSYLEANEMTGFSGLLSVYYLFLFRFTGQEDILVGITTAGRMQEELEDLVGMFVKILPVRYKLDTAASYKEFLSGLHKYLVQAMGKQVYDLANIISDLNKSRTAVVTNLLEAAFAYQNFGSSDEQANGGAFSMLGLDNNVSKYPISLIIDEAGNSFLFRFEYLSGYFTESDMEMLMLQFKSLLLKIIDNMDAGIIELLGSGEPSATYVEDDISFSF